MDTIRARLEWLFDLAILSHGVATHMRDYIIEAELGGQSEHRGHYVFTFTHCVIANYSTAVRDDTWRTSWDDVFIDYARWLRQGEPVTEDVAATGGFASVGYGASSRRGWVLPEQVRGQEPAHVFPIVATGLTLRPVWLPRHDQ